MSSGLCRVWTVVLKVSRCMTLCHGTHVDSHLIYLMHRAILAIFTMYCILHDVVT